MDNVDLQEYIQESVQTINRIGKEMLERFNLTDETVSIGHYQQIMNPEKYNLEKVPEPF